MKVDAVTRRKLAEIGRTLRAVRIAAGISQALLAAQIGMGRENYVRLETGRVNATVDTLLRVARGMGLDLQVGFVASRIRVSKQRPSKTNDERTASREGARRAKSAKAKSLSAKSKSG